jgi:tetratricopeptide (TPR) repeat protein
MIERHCLRDSSMGLTIHSVPQDCPPPVRQIRYTRRAKGGCVVSIDSKPQAAIVSNRNFFLTDSPARTLLLGLLLSIVIFAVYSPVHGYPFANLDDPKYVTQNPHIQNGLTVSTVVWAFTHGYAANWHPLTWISHALDIQIFGLDPAGHHDENVLFHALDAVLLFWVLKRATGYLGRSFMVAALFAIHPLNVESVAWIAERKTMLSTLFCLLALGAYRWYASKPAIGRYLVVAGLFVLGLMCKPQIIMLPLVLLLWDYWPLQRMFAGGRRPPVGTAEVIPGKEFWWLVKEKIPLFFICLVDAALTLVAQHAVGSSQPYTLWIRIENAIVSYARYVGKAVWPSNLALYYPHPAATLRWWQVAGAFLLLLLITALAVRARRHRFLIVGWLWFLIMLVPMIGILQVDVQGMADRYAYVSFIGLFLMICWGVADWAAERRMPKALLPAVSVVVLLALSVVTYRQIGYWSSDVTLWAHSAEVTSGNWKAEFYLATALDADGQHQQARQHYRQAAAINPFDPFTNLNIATYELQHGNPAGAIEYYKRVLPEAWNSEQKTQVLTSMAIAYRQLGDTASASECMASIKALPQRNVDWQGAWWKNIIPMIRQYFHHGAS